MDAKTSRVEVKRQQEIISHSWEESLELSPDLTGVKFQDWVETSGFDLILEGSIKDVIGLDNIKAQVYDALRREEQAERQQVKARMVELGIYGALMAISVIILIVL